MMIEFTFFVFFQVFFELLIIKKYFLNYGYRQYDLR
jgi:hypothetical protein